MTLAPIGWWILGGIVIALILAFVFLPTNWAAGITIAVALAFAVFVIYVLANTDFSH